VKELEAQLEQEKSSVETNKEKEISSNKEAEELESQMNNYDSHRDHEMKDIEVHLLSFLLMHLAAEKG